MPYGNANYGDVISLAKYPRTARRYPLYWGKELISYLSLNSKLVAMENFIIVQEVLFCFQYGRYQSGVPVWASFIFNMTCDFHEDQC